MNASNITSNGVMGDGSNGVLTVTSSIRHPSYDSRFDIYGLGLIRTKSVVSDVYPYSNLFRDKVNFYVRANGQVYTTGLLLPAATASVNRSAASTVSSALVSPLSKLQSLHGVVYRETEEDEALNPDRGEVMEASAGQRQASAFNAQEISRQMELEKDRNRIGLLAWEVEQVFPDAVRTLSDGSKGILYSDLIAILIESVKELQDSLAVVKARMEGTNISRLPAVEGMELASAKVLGEKAVLYQNTPNPFNRETEISYRLGENVRTASICIYNLNGQQLKKYPVSVGSSTGTITVSASEFQPGMYIYALIIDNEMADSKRMTLTD